MSKKEKNSNDNLMLKIIGTADALMLTAFIGLTGSAVINKSISNNRVKDIDNNLISRTDTGVPIFVRLSKDKTLDVIIDESFNDIQKQNIKEAIQELDVDLKGVNYNILLNSDKAGKKCINITKGSFNEENFHALAVTSFNANRYFGNVIFPVKISISSDFYNMIYGDPNFDKENMSEIIKHEMLHVLGFNDVYDKEYQNKTIMYGIMDENTTLFDLSQADKDMVNTVYKPITKDAVKVETYEPFYYPINLNVNMQDEDLSM